MTEQAPRVLLGRIVAAHGIRGEVVVETFTANPEDIAAYGPLQSADGARTFELKVVRRSPKGGVVARVAGVADRNGAEALRKTELYALRSDLPEAEAGEYYHTDLIGLRVEDASGAALGKVVSVQNYGAGDLLEIRLDGVAITELVPFTDTFVPTVDVAGGRVVVEVPVASVDDAEDAALRQAAEEAGDGDESGESDAR
ncbi:ribosome maturation factor RimM [Hyphomicrobium sp. D-2]|uniref:ribosome maturation factor RimM n=1 Tax=Hyphomicrobium sp. D-2 TaxID=3041621 RepID=UPI002458795B|nr:ribosome maturation factor RimM [Hyphomicrobium sp. D-2]MDH4983445.1 ribosome maturation factor RimM [Hyphomicrobium sp. D-2]